MYKRCCVLSCLLPSHFPDTSNTRSANGDILANQARVAGQAMDSEFELDDGGTGLTGLANLVHH
jgi:hypothetical protein